jgi:hypothetical protein
MVDTPPPSNSADGKTWITDKIFSKEFQEKWWTTLMKSWFIPLLSALGLFLKSALTGDYDWSVFIIAIIVISIPATTNFLNESFNEKLDSIKSATMTAILENQAIIKQKQDEWLVEKGRLTDEMQGLKIKNGLQAYQIEHMTQFTSFSNPPPTTNPKPAPIPIPVSTPQPIPEPIKPTEVPK